MEFKTLVETIKSYYTDLSESEIQKISEGFEYLETSGTKIQQAQSHDILKRIIRLNPGVDTICTILIQGFPTDDPFLEDQYYNSTIKFLHQNLEKLKNITVRSDTEDSENIKRILIALSKDIRVLIIHLARYVWRLQNANTQEPKNAEVLARTGLKIHAPIAEKLDMYVLKAEIEDASFKILNPELFDEIEADSIQNETQQDIIKEAIQTIQKILKDNKLDKTRVEGRKKNVYSVYEKMKRKNFHSVREVYDLFAIRIITQTPEECYQILGQIHTHFTPITSRFKDFIAVPKSNGYKSIHTTVLGLGSNPNPTEIQIQDESMYQQARYGTAAHWAYKKTKSSDFSSDFLTNYNWIKEARDSEDIRPEDIFDDITQKVNTERIHVFTPKGDIINLPKDGTPVDFAFAIHSQVGESIVNAKVNGNIRPLNYELESGDVVEVITKKGRKPNPFWLTFIKSQNAKGKIKNYLNKARSGEIPKIKEAPEKKPTFRKIIKLPRQKLETPKKFKIMIGGETDIPFKIASCCKPKQKHPIIAYNSRGLEFVVHRTNCKLLKDLEQERFMEANFVQTATLIINSKDHFGFLQKILEIISKENLNVTQSNLNYDKPTFVKATLEIEYTNLEQIENAMQNLENIPNTITVEATS